MYDFNKIYDRSNTFADSVEGFKEYIFNVTDASMLPRKQEDYIRMGIADMDFGAPDVIIDAMKARLDKNALGYTKISGDRFSTALNDWCKRRYDWSFDPKDLVTSHGIVPAIFNLISYVCEEDENVLILTPSYGRFHAAAEYNKRETICSDLIYDNGNYSIDFEDLEKKASDPKTTMFILCNPHNPTGRVWSQEDLEKIAEIMVKHDLWIISDEIHCDLLRKGLQHIPLGKILPDYKKLITAMATSKTFNLAGLMLSSIIIRDEELLSTWKSHTMTSENPLSLEATLAAYDKGEPWLNELIDYLDENFVVAKDYIETHLDKAIFTNRESTYLAWINLGAYFDKEEDLKKFFAYEAGVILDSGKAFVQHSEGFVRVNIACPRAVMLEGLKRIVDAVNNK